ncbi:MAG: TonB-dependent siderophore receptor [Candidatus Latescibacteria bacterium]|nr:TonB-dependent siderophore receptor [Candidatus Latescibacterota bacterium]
MENHPSAFTPIQIANRMFMAKRHTTPNWAQAMACQIRRRFFVLLTLVAVPLAAAAQEARYTFEEIVVTDSLAQDPGTAAVAAKVPLSIHLTPASVGVVTAPHFAQQGQTGLGQALQSVSGVNIQSGFGVSEFFTVRGFDSLENGLILTDGAAEPEVSFYYLYNLDRLEVLKGPGAFLYGGNPLSGTVNLVRKRPRLAKFAHLTGSLGSFQSYRGQFDGGWARPQGDLALRLNALWQASEGYRDDKDNDVVAVNPALTYRFSERASLTLNLEYTDSAYKSDAGLPLIAGAVAPVPRTRSYQSPFDQSDQQILRGRLDLTAVLTSSLTLRNKFYYTNFEWLSQGSLFVPSSQLNPVPEGLAARVLTALDDQQTLTGNQLEILWRGDTGPLNHELIIGTEISRLQDDFTLDVAFLPPIAIDDPVETAAKPFFFLPGQSDTVDARSLVVAPYLIDRIDLGRGYQLLLGGRFDRVDYEDGENGLEQTYEEFSPMAGLTFAPREDWSLYASAGRAFAPPSSRGKGARQAETSTQVEVGARRRFDQGRVGLALYQLDKDVTSDDGVTRFAGDQRSSGLELEGALQLPAGWRVDLNYAFISAELRDFTEFNLFLTENGPVEFPTDHSDNTPAFAPEHIADLWVAKKLGSAFTAGLGARYVHEQFIAPDNAYAIDSVLTFDASLAYYYGPGVVRLHLKNLTDQAYETRGFGAFSVIPADPFSLNATIDWAL